MKSKPDKGIMPSSQFPGLVSADGEDGRASLIDPTTVRNDLASILFADSHGAFDDYLGAGLLYYTMAQLVRAQVAVCIGSGGGFVPTLLRRAQLDARITPARTYLIDANLPDLDFGSPIQTGGWMTKENQFLQRERDIAVLRMLSIDAARLFAAQNLLIDYLHIDGDHSSAGVLADFHAFAPMVSPMGAITMHDLRMPSVVEALKTIETEFPQWDVLTFPEVGGGTVLLRRRISAATPQRPQNRAGFVDCGRRVDLDDHAVTDATANSQVRARFERWPYLSTDAYRLRYRLAIAEIDRVDATLIEIGGFPNSILDMVEHATTVHAVEPYAPNQYVSRLEQRAAATGIRFFLHRGSFADLSIDIDSLGTYRLVALGLDLSSGDEDAAALERAIAMLIRLLCKAERSVVEFPRYQPSMILWDFLEKLLAPKRRFDVMLDFTNDPVADEYFVRDSRARRRLMVIDQVREIDLDTPELRTAVRSVATEIAAAHGSVTAPVNSTYRLGEDIIFRQGGNAEGYKRAGWGGAERKFAWSCGEESHLVLDIVPGTIPSATAFRLVLRLRPFVVRKKHESQRLSISVNGHEVLHECELRKLRELRIPIPRSVLLAQDPVRIRFFHPDCRVPANLSSGSADPRELAFAVFSLAVAAIPAAVDGPKRLRSLPVRLLHRMLGKSHKDS